MKESGSLPGEFDRIDIRKTVRNIFIRAVPGVILQLQSIQYGQPIDVKNMMFGIVISTLIEFLRRVGNDNSIYSENNDEQNQ